MWVNFVKHCVWYIIYSLHKSDSNIKLKLSDDFLLYIGTG